MEKDLPPIPAKRYFTIGEVGDLCGVKPHVLRYWEQEFTQLRPMKRRGNRRYYQHHEVLMIRRIRELLYDQGFTISGARNKLQELVQAEREKRTGGGAEEAVEKSEDALASNAGGEESSGSAALPLADMRAKVMDASSWRTVKQELMEIRSLLADQI
jgi:DNA-binding transcriptional MerR regulator